MFSFSSNSSIFPAASLTPVSAIPSRGCSKKQQFQIFYTFLNNFHLPISSVFEAEEVIAFRTSKKFLLISIQKIKQKCFRKTDHRRCPLPVVPESVPRRWSAPSSVGAASNEHRKGASIEQ